MSVFIGSCACVFMLTRHRQGDVKDSYQNGTYLTNLQVASIRIIKPVVVAAEIVDLVSFPLTPPDRISLMLFYDQRIY